MATTYCTITELKARVSVDASDTSEDTKLQAMLDAAAVKVDELTRGYLPGVEAFSASASATRLFDDYLTGVIEIDDCLSVTALTQGGTTITDTYYKLHPY